MAITMSDIRAHLDPDEVDYNAARRLGAEALPLLNELAGGDDPMLASKATYLASLIPGKGRLPVLAMAATSRHATVRVAAASGLRNLKETDIGPLADNLLQDADIGVRKQAVRSVAGFASPEMAARVRQMADADPEETLRGVAAELLQE